MSMLMRTTFVYFTVLMLISTPSLAAEGGPSGVSSDRPRIALVMGGGGAHAVANLGVLKELERQNVPIDLIVGVGVGGLIGGLYASGMSIDEIGTLLTQTDWPEIFNPDTRREDLSFRRKQDDDDFLIKYKVGIKDGQAQLPKSLLPNGKFGWLLQKVTANTKGLGSFDELPISYRAMTMDMVSGELVALDGGALDRALLATLAAPGTLPPVEIDGRLLVTGSLLNNLPVDVARAWGADIIIAVDVGVFTRPVEDLNSVFRIVDQVSHLVQKDSTKRGIAQMHEADILIQPRIDPDAETDFSNIDETIAAGQAAMVAASARLAPLGIDQAGYVTLVSKQAARRILDPVVTRVIVTNDSRVADEVIESKINQPLNAPLDKQQLESDLRDIYALGAFQTVEFDLLDEADGKALEIRTVEDVTSRKFWRFGVSLEDDFQGNSAYTGSASFTWTQINRLNAEWRSVLRIGEFQQLSTELYQPVVDSGKWFVSVGAGFVERNVNAFVDDEIVQQFRVEEIAGQVAAGRVIGNTGEIRLGIMRGEGKARVNIGPEMPSQKFDLGGWIASAAHDSYDNVYFPKRGLNAAITWNGQRESLGSTIDVDIVAGNLGAANTWGAHSLLTSVTLQSQLNEVEGVQNLLTIGGLFNLSGYQRDSLSGRHTGVARAIYYREIRSNPLRGFLRATMYLGGSLELGNAWQDSDDISLSNSQLAGSVFVGLDTFIGPVYFAGGLAEGGESAIYLFIGRPQ